MHKDGASTRNVAWPQEISASLSLVRPAAAIRFCATLPGRESSRRSDWEQKKAENLRSPLREEKCRILLVAISLSLWLVDAQYRARNVGGINVIGTC